MQEAIQQEAPQKKKKAIEQEAPQFKAFSVDKSNERAYKRIVKVNTGIYILYQDKIKSTSDILVIDREHAEKKLYGNSAITKAIAKIKNPVAKFLVTESFDNSNKRNKTFLF